MPILLTTTATFAIITTVVLSLGRVLTAQSPVTQRIRDLVGDAGRLARKTRKRSGLITRLVMALGKVLGDDRSVSQRLAVAGFRGPNATAIFLGTRTLLSVGPALATLVPAMSSGKPLGSALVIPTVAWLGGHTLANLWLKRRARDRVRQITKALPDALDLMVVCLESGLGLNATIQRVGDERATIADVLGNEFAQVAFELRNGRPRVDALRALGTRNGVDDLKALVGLVIQSDKLGASMAKTLRTHADLLRTKRRQRAEGEARKLPIKVLFPLAFFILPALFVVTVGPAMLRIKDLAGFISKK